MMNQNNPNQIPNPVQGDVQSAVNVALEQEKKKKKKKKLIIIGVIAVVVIAIIAIGSGGNDEGKKVESLDGSTTAAAQTEEETSAAETQKVEAGNSVTTNSLKISYISCDTNFKKYSEYSAPAKGNKVVRAQFKFENTSESDVSLSNFECYADNKKCEEFYGVDDYSSPTLETVSAGRTLDAVIYFEVPANSKEIELEFEDSLWGNEKTIFVIK